MEKLTERIVARILAEVRQKYPVGDAVSMTKIEACDPQVIYAYSSGQRVKIRNEKWGDTRTGIVSRTTGWKPCLLLMHRSNAIGSSDILGPDDKIVAIWNGRKYIDRTHIY
jgi:hypothetical protein